MEKLKELEKSELQEIEGGLRLKDSVILAICAFILGMILTQGDGIFFN